MGRELEVIQTVLVFMQKDLNFLFVFWDHNQKCSGFPLGSMIRVHSWWVQRTIQGEPWLKVCKGKNLIAVLLLQFRA